MNKPKVSVITVVYNDVNNIELTIKNVLKQTYSNLEYIVIDGASSDGTLDVIKKYTDSIVWRSEPDKGIYDAMQKGAQLASGEWILYRNCGDFFATPSAIEDLFSSYDKDEGEDFLIADIRYFKEYGYKDFKPSILTKSYLESMPVFHPSTFVRRSTQLRYPFHLEYRYSADYCFFVESFLNGAKYRYFDILLSLYNNETGASTDSFDKSLKDNIDFLIKFGVYDSSHIKRLKYKMWKCIINKKIKRYFPFYSWYHKKHLKDMGWIECDLNTVLKNI